MKRIEITDLSFRYRNAGRRALEGISMSVERGEFVGIFGATGAGKSSLARTTNRIIPMFFKGEFSGNVRINGSDISGKNISEMSALVGMVFQEFESQLFSTNVEHEIAFGCENLAVPKGEIEKRIRKYGEFSGLATFKGRSPSTLSGGEKQRLAIASVLSMETPIIVMDEPTTDLDPAGKASIFGLLSQMKDEERTTLLIEHETEEAFLLDRIIVIDDGKVAADGSPDDILSLSGFLMEKGIKPPDISLLGSKLRCGKMPNRMEEAFRFLMERGLVPKSEKYAAMLNGGKGGSPPEQEEIISVDNLHFGYDSESEALSGIDLSVRQGEFIALLGANGSGKTTLAKHLNGLLKPSSGKVFFRGNDVATEKVSSMGRKVGYIFQNPDHQIFSNSIAEEVGFGPSNFGFSPSEIERRVAEALETVNLTGREKEDPFAMTKGERQKVAVASIIASSPEVIIMDEPTTGLDYIEQKRVMALLRRLNEMGHTIIIITHSVWLAAEYARRIIVMRQGKIIKDSSPRELFGDDYALREGHIEPPAITRLGKLFGIVPLTVDEFFDCCQ